MISIVSSLRREIENRVKTRIAEKSVETAFGQFIIVGEEFCPVCTSIKELYREEFESRQMRYVDVDTPEGALFEENYDLSKLPFVVFHNLVTEEYTMCGFRYDGEGNIEIFQKEEETDTDGGDA